MIFLHRSNAVGALVAEPDRLDEHQSSREDYQDTAAGAGELR